MKPIRIIFCIDKLNQGGAERQLIELVKGINKRRFEVSAVVFQQGGTLLNELEKVPLIKLYVLERKSNRGFLKFFIGLYYLLKKIRPDILNSYMGGTNELCLILGRLIGCKVIWGIRSSNMNLRKYGWKARLIFRAGIFLSYFTDLMISNSFAGKVHYAQSGYCDKKIIVIHNGINTKKFKPNLDDRKGVRQEWRIDDDKFIIGIIARLDPMKDHKTFLKAAAILIKKRDDVFFVCVGDGPDLYKKEIMEYTKSIGVSTKLIWTGAIEDISKIYNAFDIITSSSVYGEGFSNVIGEAMSCGVPCVVTDVGDSALIVGETGIVVPPQNPEALAHTWQLLIEHFDEDQYKLKLSKTIRERIIKKFRRDLLVEQTEKTFERLLKN